MKNWIINLLGCVTIEKYQKDICRLQDNYKSLRQEMNRFSESYAIRWLNYKSSRDYKSLKAKLLKLVRTEKPKADCDFDWDDGYTILTYKDGSFLKEKKHEDEKSWRGFVAGYGDIPSELAKEMYEIAHKLLLEESNDD